MTRFVVLFPGRTGSTFLVEALDVHPLVCARYEVMASGLDNRDSPEEQIERARRAFTSPQKRDYRACGFKTKLRDVLDRPGFAALLEELAVRPILLTRRNVVKLNVSSFNAARVHERTGDWNLYERQGLADEPLWIDPDDFVQRLGEYEQELGELATFVGRLGRPALWLFYENLVLDPAETVAQAFRFLGVEPVSARGRTLKSTADDLRLALRNFDELRGRFAGTRYEAMFDERLPAASEAA
jgi:hypothetical protein